MSFDARVKIRFEPHGKSVEVQKGSTVLDAAIKAGIGIRSECGGVGTCGKCRILANDHKILSAITLAEKRMLKGEELEKGFRLACQARVLDHGEIYVPKESRIGERKVLEVGYGLEVALDPAVKKVHLLIPRPALSDARADLERMLDSLTKVLTVRGEFRSSSRFSLDHDLLSEIPNILREADWNVTVVLREDEIVGIEKGDTERENYGLAIDIGTSKVVIYLVDVNEGKVLSVVSFENPQLMFGEDILSRLTYAMKSSNNRLQLKKILLDEINRSLKEMAGKLGLKTDRIYEAVVVGNTAMHHLFFGIETKYLAISPYVPATRDFVCVKSREIGMEIMNRGYVLALPIIGGFVGSDGVADILATGLHEFDEVSMLLDIGTNTEVFLGNKERILACSAASGPAFEGGHIKFGMKASAGAIERVEIDPKSLEVNYKTIGNVKPVGLCGSAIIDAIAGLLKSGILEKNGRMREVSGTSRLRRVGGQMEFVIAWKDEAGVEEDITITQKDVREVQLAKAAIYSAQYILMRRMGIGPWDVERVFVAGAFGSGIDVKNAVLIGLFPEEHAQKVEFVGNTAISGAKMALISKKVREESKEVLRLVEHVELSLDPSFESEFISATELPHKDLDRFPSVRRILFG